MIKIILLILLSFFVVSAQSSEDLRQKYGAPVSETYSEVYTVRPSSEKIPFSVQVTVTYTKNKEICRMLVEVFPYFRERNNIPTKDDALKDQLLKEIIEEILPAEKRGKNIINGFISGSCTDDDCFGTYWQYEKVTIFYNGNNHRYARISFKNVNCN